MTDIEQADANIEALLLGQADMRAEIRKLRADNERLRAALHAIADRERPSTARSMARRALEPMP